MIPLVLKAAADAAIQKKKKEKEKKESGTTSLIISNKEIEDIMKILQPLEELGLLIKRISEIIKNEAKERKGGFLLHYIRKCIIRTRSNKSK